MPEAWSQLLQSANIPVAEQIRDPELMLDVLQTYEESTNPEDKFMTNISGIESAFCLPCALGSFGK